MPAELAHQFTRGRRPGRQFGEKAALDGNQDNAGTPESHALAHDVFRSGDTAQYRTDDTVLKRTHHENLTPDGAFTQHNSYATPTNRWATAALSVYCNTF